MVLAPTKQAAGTFNVPADARAGISGSPSEAWSGSESEAETVQTSGRDGTNSLKRKRPETVSCELCKQRKVRCDRTQPSCGWCSRNGQVCEYKERKKPGLRAGYGKELESRIDQLESMIKAQARMLEKHIESTAGSQQQPIPVVQPPPANRVEEVRAPPETESVSPKIHTPSSHQSFYGQANQNPLDDTTSQETLQIGQEVRFPPYDLLYALVDLYFKHINTWCPILHRRTTLETLFGPPRLKEDDRILLHAIVATTLRFSQDPRLTDESRKYFHDSSKQKVLLYGLENSSIKALQALVILALDLVGSSNGPPGWNLLALLTRSVVQLGLSVEPGSTVVSPSIPSVYTLREMMLPGTQSFVELESQRRLFWMIYLLDRYATIATTFDFALDEREIDRKLPCRDDLISRNTNIETKWFHTSQRTDYTPACPENIGTFGFYIECLGIYSKIHRFAKAPIDISALEEVSEWQATYRRLESELKEWKFNLPNEYGNSSRIFSSGGNTKPINCGWIMLHATYHTAMVRLHCCAAYPTFRSPIFTPSYSAGQRCIVAVESITSLAQYAAGNDLLDKLGPPFAFSLWVCARLLLVHGSTIEHKVDPSIEFFVQTLRGMGKYWKVAGRYSTILQRVLDECRESERSLDVNGERITPSTVQILSDMRQCAFDLDFLISNQPRQHLAMLQDGKSGNGNGTLAAPAQRSAPDQLEYLDVFDFFNMPRLPVQLDAGNGRQEGVDRDLDPSRAGAFATDLRVSHPATPSNEFNISNFMLPNPETDWLFRAGNP